MPRGSLSYFEDNDKRYLDKYFEQMFDIIQNRCHQSRYYWYLHEEGIEALYSNYVNYLKTGEEKYAVSYYKAMIDSLL